jgi:hypothetical protein
MVISRLGCDKFTTETNKLVTHPCAGPRIGAVGIDLKVARHRVFSFGWASISSNSASSISCTLRRSVSPKSATPFDLVQGIIAAVLGDCD